MNKKLKRLIDEEERTAARIEELQSRLKEIRIARKLEEDQEIVRSIRTMKLGARELLSLLTGIQDGSVSIESILAVDSEEDIPADPYERSVNTEENLSMIGAKKAPESEEKHE